MNLIDLAALVQMYDRQRSVKGGYGEGPTVRQEYHCQATDAAIEEIRLLIQSECLCADIDPSYRPCVTCEILASS